MQNSGCMQLDIRNKTDYIR